MTDNRLLGDAFKSLMHGVSELSFVGSVEPDPSVLKRLPSLRPTVIVVDTSNDRETFMEAMQVLQAVLPSARCLGLNVSPIGDTVIRCAEAGIRGCDMRDDGKEETFQAIHGVSAGRQQVLVTSTRAKPNRRGSDALIRPQDVGRANATSPTLNALRLNGS